MPPNSASPSTSFAFQSVHYQEIHGRLMESGTYLGDKDFKANVKWEKIGHCNKVTEINDNTIALAHPDPSSNTSDDSSNPAASTEDELDDVEDECNVPIKPEIAGITAVVKISANDFFFTPDGGFNGTNKFTTNFSQLVLSLSGAAPSIEPFKSDYPMVVENVKWLLSQSASKKGTEKLGFLVGPPTAHRLKVRHKLFEAVPEDPDDYDDQKDWAMIRNWPVVNDAAHSGIATIFDSHRVIHPKVYNIQGHRIHPKDYCSMLQHATVKPDFELSHWAFESNGKKAARDVYSADLAAIHTIIPPPKGSNRQKCDYDKLNPCAALRDGPPHKKRCIAK
ncbi:hypothetical protein BDQ17DRAFT_1339252 [Cyathus striatus]|nr:hypothetical protein BDQ17DRAFT_1339252 [Cyathus striatus]